jgi:alpha-tubulin suppressor-like RCC1 family protein
MAVALLVVSFGAVNTSSAATGSTPIVYSKIAASTGDLNNCAITDLGNVKCWGYKYPGANFIKQPKGLGSVKQISVGGEYGGQHGSHICAINIQEAAICWGLESLGQTVVPPNMGKVAQISAAGNSTCAVNIEGLLRCWGQNTYGQTTVPSTLGKVSKIALAEGRICVIRYEGDVKCWGYNNSNQNSIPKELGLAKQIAASQTHTCIVTVEGKAKCWGQNNAGQTNVPNNLGEVLQISVGAFYSCALNAEGILKCWGSNAYGAADVPSNLGSVKHVSAGIFHTCAVTQSGVIKCWGHNNHGQSSSPLAFALVPGAPADLSTQLIYSPSTSSVWLRFKHLGKETDGTLNWTFRNVTDGRTVCENSFDDLECVAGDLDRAKKYVFSLQGENEAGKTEEIYFDEFTNCPPWRPSWTLSLGKSIVTSGSIQTLAGKLANLCEDPPKFYESRFKQEGGLWSSWTKGPLNKWGGFTIKRKLLVNSTWAVRAKTGTGKSVTQSISTPARIKTLFPIWFSSKSAKTQGGFNQGGTLSVTFSGDSLYSGLCTVEASTKAAYNFALTYMGSEFKRSTFKVQNGKGSGKISLYWNGTSTFVAQCVSSKFATIIDTHRTTFKANF